MIGWLSSRQRWKAPGPKVDAQPYAPSHHTAEEQIVNEENPYEFKVAPLLQAAREATGLEDFGDPRFEEGLGVLCEMLATGAGLGESGRRTNWKRLLRLLATRLRVEAAFGAHPEIREREIRRPMFLTGLPRTGTSATFNLLGMDPATRPLLLWEGTFPEPLDGLEEGVEDPRHAAMKETFAKLRERNPDFTRIHFTDADTPEECVIPMAITFENVHQGIEALVEPYASFFRDLDLAPQYRYYRDLLKMIDWQRPGDRWLLKSPAHLWAMDVIVETFPDCCIILTHRDPVEAIASYCSMMESLLKSQGFSAQADLGERVLDFCATSLERGYAVRDRSDPSRFIDIRFADFVSDSMAVMDQIYEHFELTLEPAGRSAMEAHLAENPRGKHGSHDYDLERYGLNQGRIRERLGWYIDRFELA